MSSAVSSKIIKKSPIDADDLNIVSKALTGEEKDPFIVWDYSHKVIKNMLGIAKTLESFLTSGITKKLMTHVDVPKAKEFISMMRKIVSPELFPVEEMDPRGKGLMPTDEDKEKGKRLVQHFDGILKSPIYKRLIILSKNLNEYQQYIQDKDNLQDFLARPEIVTFVPFHFATLDFKQHVWDHVDFQDDGRRKFILLMFHILWRRTKTLVDVYKAPHYDVDQIKNIVMQVISSVGNSVPELSRCKQAFGIIEQSVSLLKDKMPEYQSEAVRSGDSMSVFTSFISDASKAHGKMDRKTMSQFARIINFFKNRIRGKMSASGQKNDQISKFLDFVEKPLGALEEQSKGYDLDEEEKQFKETMGNKTLTYEPAKKNQENK